MEPKYVLARGYSESELIKKYTSATPYDILGPLNQTYVQKKGELADGG